MTYTIEITIIIIKIMTHNFNTQGLLNAKVTTTCSHMHVGNPEPIPKMCTR